MRIGIPSKKFEAGKILTFKVYDFAGNLITSKNGTEVGNLGFYYVDLNLSPFRSYLIVVYEDGLKIACKPIYRFLRWGLRSQDDVTAPDGETRRFLRGDYNFEGWNT